MAQTPVPGDLTAPFQPGPPRHSLWRHGDFVRMWTGQTISLLGSQVTLLALPLTAILVFKVYQDGVQALDLGGSAAQSVILMAIVIALTVAQFRFVERKVQY